jgi:hypothetical protein
MVGYLPPGNMLAPPKGGLVWLDICDRPEEKTKLNENPKPYTVNTERPSFLTSYLLAIPDVQTASLTELYDSVDAIPELFSTNTFSFYDSKAVWESTRDEQVGRAFNMRQALFKEDELDGT